MLVREAIDRFISTRHGADKSAAIKLLIGNDEEYTNKSFELDKIDKKSNNSEENKTKISSELEPDTLADNIMESVKRYTRNKHTAISIYKDFVKFINANRLCDTYIDVTFPPIDISSKLERQLYMLKYFQDKSNKRSDLSDILWVSPRTIDSDISELMQYNQDGKINILGTEFKMKEIHSDNGGIAFESTVHPLMLTPNITQVYALINGLESMSRKNGYSYFAKLTAASIWKQLTDYAKNRLIYVSEELGPHYIKWYDEIDGLDPEMFYTEKECCIDNPCELVVNCTKNGLKCFIEYENDEGEHIIYKNCNTKRYNDDIVRVIDKNGEHLLKFSQIKKSSYNPFDIL